MGNYINLKVKDASDMQVYVAQPKGVEPFPVILVFQEAFGVNNHIRDIADRIAREGYLAIAPELFHRTAAPGFVASYTDFEQVRPHIQAITTENVEHDLQAVYDWIKDNKQVQPDNLACIGFCMGGRISFIANSYLQLKATVSFYGGGIQNLLERVTDLKAPQLFFWGGKDHHIRPEHIQSITEALRNADKQFINVEISDADHGFFCNERTAYNPQAATESWEFVKAFFKNKL